MENTPLLEIRNIGKRFAGVQALDDVSIALRPGEIHALMGENGAGKSTLVKILAGAYIADEGEILWKGEKRKTHDPGEIRGMGIAVVYQESSLVADLSVGENIFLGRLPGNGGVINWKLLWEQSGKVLAGLDLDVGLKTKVSQLSAIDSRMVEIAKALTTQADLIVLDEPTASLSVHEIDILFNKLTALRQRGICILYISHYLEEVFLLADRITVLRDGRVADTVSKEQTTPTEIVILMAGRKLDEGENDRAIQTVNSGPKALEVVGLTRGREFSDISFDVRAGEVVGLAGTVGSGRSALARTIFRLQKPDSGDVFVGGRKLKYQNPAGAIQAGIGFLTNNRRKDGLIMNSSIVRNISLPVVKQFTRAGLVNRKQERALAEDFVTKLDIKTSGLNQTVVFLSGGNQQKVVLAKWLAVNPQVLILDGPTQGVDVGAKSEIYKFIDDLAAKGVAILLISSEPEEFARLCHRVLVMRRGRIVGELTGEQVNREAILAAVVKGTDAVTSAA